MATGPMCKLWAAGLVVVALACVLRAAGQEDPGQPARRQAARDVIAVLTGDNLTDAERGAEVSKRIMEITMPEPPPQSWTDMCAEAKGLASAPNTTAAAAILRALGADTFAVPNVENSTEASCTVTTFPDCSRFEDDAINLWLANLFITTSTEAPIQVTLSRFDLSSAAMFLDSANNDCGLLFRARFFPKEDENNFPFNLGFCQIGSNIEFDQNSMDFRNFLWFKDKLVVLDLSEGSVLQELLLEDESFRLARTIFEEDLGLVVATINYFGSLEDRAEAERIFVC